VIKKFQTYEIYNLAGQRTFYSCGKLEKTATKIGEIAEDKLSEIVPLINYGLLYALA
jgi:hypothetical protein